MWIEIIKIAGALVWLRVTSLAEVWIEIPISEKKKDTALVTSLAEVWIEIPEPNMVGTVGNVTSLAEVWIEIMHGTTLRTMQFCHFPRGSVD